MIWVQFVLRLTKIVAVLLHQGLTLHLDLAQQKFGPFPFAPVGKRLVDQFAGYKHGDNFQVENLDGFLNSANLKKPKKIQSHRHTQTQRNQ